MTMHPGQRRRYGAALTLIGLVITTGCGSGSDSSADPDPQLSSSASPSAVAPDDEATVTAA